MTLGQETRWAYSTTFPSPHRAYVRQIQPNEHLITIDIAVLLDQMMKHELK